MKGFKKMDKLGNLDALENLVPEQRPLQVAYQAHLQDYGWLPEVCTGIDVSTAGEGKRLEAVKIKLLDAPQGAGIKYSLHVADRGWLPYVSDGAIGGTTGESRRAEAIKIELIGLAGYTVSYRVFMQGKNWSDWCSDGQVAGTTGESRQLEDIEIKISEKK